jgi:holo-[acyl-carrier protein] synthase
VVVGVGVDLIEIERIKQALDDARTGRRLARRVYTTREIEYCERKNQGKYQSYAGRFAAKEAVMKALGRGWGKTLNWLEIEILPAIGGRPAVRLSGGASSLAERLGVERWALSITHTAGYAMAYVIAEREEKN